MQNGLHELAMIAHHGTLAGVHGMRLGPPQPNADTEIARLRIVVHAARIIGDVEARDADAAAGACNGHERIQDRGGAFHNRFASMATSLETDAIYGAVHLGNAENLFDLVRQRGVLREIHGFAAEAASLFEAVWNHVAYDHHRRSEEVARHRARQTHGSRPATYTIIPG